MLLMPHPFVRRAAGVLCVLLCGLSALLLPAGARAQAGDELTYRQYRELSWAADRMGHMVQYEPLDGEAGMYFAIAERFGSVHVMKATGRGVQAVWKSKQLGGVPEEVLVTDMDGDGLDDSLVCRTSNGKIYVWNLTQFTLLWESLPGEYASISCFTAANVDDDESTELVLLADNRLVYIDGATFTKEFTSINEYTATLVRCGDVDGDRRVEIVLNSGQVIDSGSGDVEWEDEAFFGRVELLDIDGDGIPEVLTENPGGGPLKVFDVDYRSEVRFQ
jgi:hypothetical protein